ncbi:MAG: hypothetical protein J7L34_05055 [Thermotogaceae bacterium]|nr:hypothetical protein [Thermotogaceae bacterium]
MKISIVQFDIEWENLNKNLNKIGKYVLKAKENGSKLVLFSEMSLSGFSMNASKIYAKEEHIEILKELSREVAIGVGYAEKCGDYFYNTYSIFMAGEKIASYSKIHLFSHGGEDKHYERGNRIETVEINGLKVTPFICYDLRFPCIFQKAALETDLFVIPASWPEKRRYHWKNLLVARAIENQAYVAGINRTGKDPYFDYSGDSLVVDPWGEIMLDAKDAEGVFTVDIDAEKIKKIRGVFPVRKDRIPEIDL